ncbi:hypothetical protein CTRI78_v011385 [Colletotrichum trifolii]|uniref:Uncharacterized protein n=1 Tax=Colletotrichum trifolii TaxID=5466 RepID=A0A4R8QEB5_COLTR|nr:hypothetical protein CTRI78_v011385 [Colletotrichum trifolii]
MDDLATPIKSSPTPFYIVFLLALEVLLDDFDVQEVSRTCFRCFCQLANVEPWIVKMRRKEGHDAVEFYIEEGPTSNATACRRRDYLEHISQVNRHSRTYICARYPRFTFASSAGRQSPDFVWTCPKSDIFHPDFVDHTSAADEYVGPYRHAPRAVLRHVRNICMDPAFFAAEDVLRMLAAMPDLELVLLTCEAKHDRLRRRARPMPLDPPLYTGLVPLADLSGPLFGDVCSRGVRTVLCWGEFKYTDFAQLIDTGQGPSLEYLGMCEWYEGRCLNILLEVSSIQTPRHISQVCGHW